MGHAPSAIAEKHSRRRPLDLLRMWHTKIEGWMLAVAGIEQPEKGVLRLKAVFRRWRPSKRNWEQPMVKALKVRLTALEAVMGDTGDSGPVRTDGTQAAPPHALHARMSRMGRLPGLEPG